MLIMRAVKAAAVVVIVPSLVVVHLSLITFFLAFKAFTLFFETLMLSLMLSLTLTLASTGVAMVVVTAIVVTIVEASFVCFHLVLVAVFLTFDTLSLVFQAFVLLLELVVGAEHFLLCLLDIL